MRLSLRRDSPGTDMGRHLKKSVRQGILVIDMHSVKLVSNITFDSGTIYPEAPQVH